MTARSDLLTAFRLASASAFMSAALAFPAASAQERVPQEDPPPAAQVDPRRLQPVDPAQFQIQDFSQLRPVRTETSERDPRLAVIDWAAAASDRERQIAEYRRNAGSAAATRAPAQALTPQISERSRESIRPVHMPVLLPVTGEAYTTRAGGEPGLMLMTRANFYDASWDVDGASVQVSGTRLINHRGVGVARAARLDQGRGPDGYRIVTNEAGLTADFSRYGAAYTVTIECGSATDPRCTDETYLRALLDRMIVAGGNPEEEG